MATTIRISGIDIERVKGSLSVRDTLEQRSTANIVIYDSTGAATYARGQAVEIFESLAVPPFIHPLFSGFIDYPRKKRISPTSNVLYWTVGCIDNHYLADKRIAAESYTGATAGAIVILLHTKYLEPEGVTLGTIDTGPTIAEMIINYRSVSDAFEALAKRSDKIWYINKAKELYFVDRSTVTAPFVVIASDIIRDPDIASELTEASPFYRNRQYIRAGKDITSLQTETRNGDGNAVAFVMGYPLAKQPAYPAATTYIKVGGVDQTVGIKGIDTLKNVYWSKGDAVITFTTAPGNGISVVCAYYGLYDIMVMTDNVPEQAARATVEGGTGIVEAIDDEPSINDKDDALDAAVAMLEHYGIIGKQFSFPIRQWGLEPGQLVTVTHAVYGLSADQLLVESVNISEVAPGELRYDIKAIEGPESGDWTGFFKALADIKSDILERITVGQAQVLIILASDTEGLELSETTAYTIWACYLVDTALVDASYVC